MAQMQVLARRVLTFLRSFYSCSQKYKKVLFFCKKRLTFTGCLAIIIPVVRPTAKTKTKYADVAELADALDSGSSSLKRVWVQIPSSAPKSSNVCSGIFCFSDLFGMTSIVPLPRRGGFRIRPRSLAITANVPGRWRALTSTALAVRAFLL